MTYTGAIRWHGLVDGQTEQQDAAPFAVYVAQLTGSGPDAGSSRATIQLRQPT